eukprot:scaffold26402_cov81-Skeletonema_marinoi.AAC.1
MTSSSTQSNNNNDTMSQPHRYTVLYYKRTNKVHKHRGTSRQDGILSIAPPPLCSVSLLDNDVANAADDNDSDDDSDDGNKYYGRHSKKNTKKQRTTKKQKKNAPKKKSGAVIYSGVNSELAKRAADIEEDEEIVLSGQWECLIISKLDGHDDANNNDDGEASKKLLGAAHNKIGTQKSRGIMNNHGKASSLLASSKSKNPLLMKQRGALTGKPGGLTSRSTGSANVGASVGNSNSSIRAPLHSVKSNNEEGMINQSSKLAVGADGLKASAQGAMTSNAAASLSSVVTSTAVASGKMKKDKNGEWYLDKSSNDDDDDDDAASASTIKTLRKTNIPSSLVRGAKASSTLGAGLMRKRPLGSIGGGISSGGGLLKRSSIAQPRSTMSSSSGLKSAAAASTNTKSRATTTAAIAPNNNNFFPGAQGDKINIPSSIREILRPHQREGIAFLWNCVTGVSVGLNNAIVRARQDAGAAASGVSCSSSLSSMGSFDLEGDGMDSDVEYDDCGVASLQGGGGG